MAVGASGASAGDSVIPPGALQPFGYTVLDSARFDVDADAAPESIELLATVERSASGALLWEDGHHWAVVVREGTLAYVLVERFLPWGRAEFAAVHEAAGGGPVVLVLTRAGSGCAEGEGSLALSVEKFTYAGDRGGFLREAVLEAAGSGVCRSPDGGWR